MIGSSRSLITPRLAIKYKKFGLEIKWLFVILVLLDYHLLYLFNYNGGFGKVLFIDGLKFVTGIIGVLIAVWIYFCYHRLINSYGQYIKYYCICVFFIFLIFSLYTIVIYPNQKIADTFRYGGRFLYPILAVMFIFLFERDGGPNKIISFLNKLCCVWYVYIILQSIVYSTTGGFLFDFDSYFSGETVNIRNESLRVGLGSFGNIILIYNLVQIFCNKKKTFFIFLQVVLGFYCLIVIQQTRMYILITFICLAFIFLVKGKSKLQIILTPLIILSLGLFLTFSSTVNEFFASFSITGEQAGSTIARLDAIDYFWNVFLDNPIFGFAWPGDEAYFSIAHGPLGTAYLSDIGFLGLLAELGLFAIPFYLLPLIRIVYILYKIGWKRVIRENMFLVVLLVYMIGTSVTLLITDSGRSIAFPFIIALYEYYYRQHKNRKQEGHK